MLGITDENLEIISVKESLLKDKKTLFSDLCSVSINTVIRTLRSLEVYLPKTKGDALLLEVLMVDKSRFHVVKHINSAFNDFRIREVKKLNQNAHQKEAKKIKKIGNCFKKIDRILTSMHLSPGEVFERLILL